MNLEEILAHVDKDQKTAQFLSDNFEKMEYLGAGPLTKVFKACSRHFEYINGMPREYYYAVRVIMPIATLQESEIDKILSRVRPPCD